MTDNFGKMNLNQQKKNKPVTQQSQRKPIEITKPTSDFMPNKGKINKNCPWAVEDRNYYPTSSSSIYGSYFYSHNK